MAEKITPPAEPTRRPPSRIVILLTGAALGALWGSVMWFIFELTGKETGFRGWLYLACTLAAMGGGVAAILGTWGVITTARRSSSGERRGRRGRRA